MLYADRSSTVAYAEGAALGSHELDTRSTDELEAEISELCAHIDAATYRLLRAIAEFDRREAWGWGFESTAHWLSWKVGIDLVTAREKVRVARALEGLPRISDKFRRGEVSYSKVRAMTRVATAKNEEYLLYIAENGTTEHVESVVRAYRRASRGEGLEEARRHREERYLDMYTDEDGMVVIRGRLPQEIAALLEKALEAAMDALKEEEKKEEKERARSEETCAPDDSAESWEMSLSMGDGELPRRCRSSQCPGVESGGASVGHDSAESSGKSIVPRSQGMSACSGMTCTVCNSAESWCRESVAQKRVDALGLLAEAALGRGLAQTERREPYQVMIHVDSAVLADASDDGLCGLENGEGISAESCRRLACDSPHVWVAQDADGCVLDIGRKARRISKPLWRALMSRDRTCQFPGCARTRHLEAHHIEHWSKGGETNPDNLLVLCKYHHWAVHEGGVRVEGRAPRELVFQRPDGTVLSPCPARLPIHGKAGETLKETNRRQGLEITAQTVDCFWDGEPMDLHMAVDGLTSCDDDPGDDEDA